MASTLPHAVVAGHLCLDIIPALDSRVGIVPGTLTRVGPATVATGGAVSNTGLALHKLGIPTRLIARVGDDALGQTTLGILRDVSPALVAGLSPVRGEASSYTVVISPPGADRSFLHCPGANDTFGPEDVKADTLAGASHFHFGYPPLMRRMYRDGGRELETVFRKAKAAGLTTSLDLAMPDPASEAGRADWPEIFRRVLPLVDLFFPSFDELHLMLGRSDAPLNRSQLRQSASFLLGLGAGLVAFKCGNLGLYVKSGAAARPGWSDLELHAPCFKVETAGTTGSGDTTIAGFLAAFLRGLGAEECLKAAAAAGACCCERTDAVGGIPSWKDLQRRIAAGWPLCAGLP